MVVVLPREMHPAGQSQLNREGDYFEELAVSKPPNLQIKLDTSG
jgi:hypothetical protein